eukprot:TRINITY_DN7182_c0_g1_i1.p1 TRINITY_DN7182_c0_g1~~TRINITY_DN7182_c0_g1_i1.p1  ORF type:complete len:1565 (+),score=417.22 TRINITY_DN7182_c0_g1_i1:40-4734(+)
MDLFANLRICVIGYSGRESLELKQKIKDRGGLLEYIIQDKTNFVVGTEKEIQSTNPKVVSAKKKKVPMVTREFVDKCIEEEKLLNISDFAFGGKRSSEVSADEPDAKRRKTDGVSDDMNVDGGDTSTASKPDEKNAQKHIPKRNKQKVMDTSSWRTARIFISSTFRDMHGERDYLTRHVFPELQERCQKLKVHVHPVDLRWGVTSDDTENALELCLTELDSCRPFFIGLLGERYGWVPSSYKVPDEPKFDWIKTTPLGKSITHLEMEYGVLRSPKAARAAFYLRNQSFLSSVPAKYKTDFIEEKQSNSESLIDLKDRIKSIVPSQYVFDNYPCEWRGVVDEKPMVGGLEDFGKHVLETFWQHLKEEFPEREEKEENPLEVERGYHERFIESHSKLFIGRKGLLSKIREFVDKSPLSTSVAPVASTTTSTTAGATPAPAGAGAQSLHTIPLVIVGQPGSGKTSLVSYFANSYLKETRSDAKTNTFVLPHFIGAAPGSTNIRSTLTRIISELSTQFSITLDKVIADDFKELQAQFQEILKKVETQADDTKFVIILDAINQLDNTNHAHALEWLPHQFPGNVKVIISTLPGEDLDVLRRRKIEELAVGALTTDEQEEIVKQTLWQYRKKLEKEQMRQLLLKADANKPLYLIVACEELRVFGVFERVSAFIQNMADTVPRLFEEVLKRIENDHRELTNNNNDGYDSRKLVVQALCLLTESRGGLLQSEMLDLLGYTKDSKDSLPESKWAAIYRSLKNYLRPVGDTSSSESESSGVLDFFHQQLPKAIKRLYLGDKNESFTKELNLSMANYFWEKADTEKDGSWDSGNKRALNFVVYHQIKAHSWKDLPTSLCSLAFIEAKCEIGLTYDLVADYLMFNEYKQKAQIPEKITKEVEEYQRFVMGRSHVLTNNPNLTFSMAYSLPSDSLPCQQAHKRYYVTGVETRPFLNWINKPQTANSCIMTLSGHDMVIRNSAHSPQGAEKKRIVSASDDHTLKVYDATTGEEIQTLRGHTNSILWCSYSPKGDFIVSAGYDRIVRLWSSDTGLVLHELKGHKGIINCCDVNPVNGVVVSVGRDRSVKLWNSTTGELLPQSFEDAHLKNLSACKFSPNGKYLVTGCEGGTIKLWSTDNWNVMWTETELITRRINSLTWSNDSKYFTASADDRSARIWDATVPTSVYLKKSFHGHKDGATWASFDSTGKRLVTASHDNLIIIWDTETGEEKSTYVGHTGSVFKAEFTPDDKYIVSCSFDRSVKVWELKEGISLVGHEARILALAFSPDGTKLLSGARDKTAIIWETLSGKLLLTLRGHTSNIFGVCWSPDKKYVCTASRDKTLRIWSSETGACLYTLVGHTDAVRCCAWSPDGEHLLSASDDKTLIIWNANQSFQKLGVLYGHRSEVIYCAYSSDGRRVASSSDDKTIKLWDTKKGKMNYGTTYVKVSTFIKHTKGVKCLGFSPDSKYLVSGAEDNVLIEWNAKNATVVSVLSGHTEDIRGCKYTADGRWILSGATDSTVRLWNSKTKQVDCKFASLSRLCAVDCSLIAFQHVFAVGDGSGQLYILTPVGIEMLDENKK